MKKKILISKFDLFLNKYGFLRSGTSWSKIGKDFSVIVHLRKSQWSNKFYLDFALAFEKDEYGHFYTKPNKADISISAENLIPSLETTILDPALDLEISNDETLDLLFEKLKIEFTILLEKMSNISTLKTMFNRGELSSGGINSVARNILNNPHRLE
jgi:hypothetical protein